jgi:hypothetical protein
MDASPAELPVGVPVKIRIKSVRVQHPRTGGEVELDGPVDFAAWDSCVFTLTSPDTKERIVVPGLCLHVEELDGQAVDKRLNVVAKRLVSALRPYLEDGSYRRIRFTITKTAERPRSTFSIATEPLP